MDFALSAEQEQLRDSARALLARECPTTRVRRTMESPAGHDPALWKTFAEAGWLGVLVPEAHGGAGLGLLDAAVLMGEMGRALAQGSYLVSSIGAVTALREGGSAAQQATWLPRLASGEAIATLAVAEAPEGRYDGAGVEARAKRRGGAHALDGTKIFAEGAQVADLVLAAFRTAAAKKNGDDFAGVELFAVPAPSRGLGVQPLVSVDETRRPCEVRFRNVTAGAAERLAGRGKGSGRALARALDACAIAVSAESVGAAERALELAVEYVKVREQFGRPVGTFQAVQHMAAEAAARLEPARALVWHAAWAFDARPREAPMAASMAKSYCADAFRAVSRTAVEMHGGIGFTWEHDMHLYYKRALANAADFGDAGFHRDRIARLARF
ncbi:MAG: acyl-CoA dehydrogenase family protein [Deltaproteobacteria bacterium]|nr:acyl-CoA dehydrogenase family protein [Deltaproteobacteria bacterium]